MQINLIFVFIFNLLKCSYLSFNDLVKVGFPSCHIKDKKNRPLLTTLSFFTADHVSHLENVSEDEINRLLGMVVDVENLFMSVHKEEDTDTKQVYFYLFKVRHNCISELH